MVPMVRLVSIENDVIGMVLLVNMHLIKPWPGWVQGNSDGPLVPIEKYVIPKVILVHMHRFKGT